MSQPGRLAGALYPLDRSHILLPERRVEAAPACPDHRTRNGGECSGGTWAPVTQRWGEAKTAGVLCPSRLCLPWWARRLGRCALVGTWVAPVSAGFPSHQPRGEPAFCPRWSPPTPGSPALAEVTPPSLSPLELESGVGPPDPRGLQRGEEESSGISGVLWAEMDAGWVRTADGGEEASEGSDHGLGRDHTPVLAAVSTEEPAADAVR